jgi:uncharacterized protein
MKRLVVAIALFVLITLPIFAQSSDDAPATKEDVQRYLETYHSHDRMQQMADAMTKPMHQMIHDQFLKDKDKLPPDFEERMNRLMDDMYRDMPWDEMTQAMIPTYQKHFTKRNINDLVAFYSSPTGQKLQQEMPAIAAESMQAMLPILQNYMQKMRGNLEQQIAELKKACPKKKIQVPDSLKN